MTARKAFFTAWIASVALASGATGGTSFTITPLVLEGDSVPGVGLVTRIDNIAVNDNGEWIVEADTDNADTDADTVLLENGSLYLREGDALSFPFGASIGLLP